MRYTYFLISFSLFLLFQNCAPKMSTDGLVTLYVGTYTQTEGHVDGKAQGIYQLKFNSTTGQITVADTIAGMVNPSFLALAPETGMLYAVNEKSPGSEGLGQLEIYDIHPEQFGTKLRSLSTGSYAPCHVVLDKARKMAVVATAHKSS